MFRHYRVIFRELVTSTSPSYTSISNAAAFEILEILYMNLLFNSALSKRDE